VAQVSAVQQPYDEDRIRAELMNLSRQGQVAFACAMGELLMPTAAWLSATTNRGDPEVLRSALDVAWRFVAGDSLPASEIEEARQVAESLVPDDQDEDWTMLSPLLQNAAASVAYALRACLASDPRDAVWAARQVHEAADYLVQLTGSDHSYVDDPASEPMLIAIRAIESALDMDGSESVVDLQSATTTDGEAFLRLLDPGSSQDPSVRRSQP
jgi:uncharacterized protein YjaG (DUF416 family)